MQEITSAEEMRKTVFYSMKKKSGDAVGLLSRDGVIWDMYRQSSNHLYRSHEESKNAVRNRIKAALNANRLNRNTV